LTVSQIGATNRVGLLYSLTHNGPSSRSELARLARVPRGSIAPIVAGLIDDGFLIEQEPATGSGKMGKPSRPLWFGPRVGHSGTLRIETDAVECARVDQSGNVLERRQVPLTPTTSRQDIEATALGLASALFQPATEPLSGIGLVWPAVWDDADGTVLSCTPIPSLVGSRLAERLRQATGCPVVIEDDARAIAIGQHWFGEARGIDNFGAVQLSTGIGAGLMVGGHLFSVEGRSPEVGHMVVNIDGAPCRCGRTGCWETLAALGWLRDQARIQGFPDWAGAVPADIVGWDAPAAASLLDTYARHIATGLVNLATAFGLNRFLLHGEVVGGGDRLLSLIRHYVRHQSTLPDTTPPLIEFSALNQRAALLGAAVLPLARAVASA
jgi:predicted NBD/HSP70 family sugar kinase